MTKDQEKEKKITDLMERSREAIRAIASDAEFMLQSGTYRKPLVSQIMTAKDYFSEWKRINTVHKKWVFFVLFFWIVFCFSNGEITGSTSIWTAITQAIIAIVWGISLWYLESRSTKKAYILTFVDREDLADGLKVEIFGGRETTEINYKAITGVAIFAIIIAIYGGMSGNDHPYAISAFAMAVLNMIDLKKE